MRKITPILVLFTAVVAMLTYGFNFPFVENSTAFNTVKTLNPSNNTDDVSKKLSEGLKFLNPQSPNLVNAYTWSQSTGTYTSISGTGTLIGTNLDDASFSGLPIGFNFQWDGPVYTTFGLNSNGFIVIGNGSPTINNYNPLSTGSDNNVISAMGRDLKGQATGNGVYRQTIGTAPNRVLIVEFKNWGIYANPALNEYNFQIQLYETSNVVQIVFGPYTPANATTVQVGLRGASNADFSNRTTTTDWSATTSGSNNAVTCSVSGSIYPSNGLTWTWTPWAFPPISYVSSTTTQNTNVVSNNSVNNQVIGMQVVASGFTPGLTLSQFNLSTTGSTNPVTDIRNAKVFFTGTSSAFSTATQFGTTVANPNGAFTVSGAQLLSSGTNYFWLTYDVPITATLNNIIDATCDSIVGSGSMGTVVPVPTAPGGGRQIFSAMSGNYVVGLGQTTPNFPTLTDAISNLSIRGVNGPVTLLVKPGVYGTDAGLEVDSTFTIPTIAGASAVNTVTIKRKSDEAGMVWVERRGTAAASEYIFRLNGASYITFDSINVRQKDSSLYKNVETGFYIVSSSSTVGSQYNTIRNCIINLTMTSGKIGIYQNMTITPTAPSGTNSYNKYYNNIISSVFTGINIYGHSGAAYPYNLYDTDVQVGVEGGNNLTNWGGGYLPYGIYAAYQRGLAVANNTIIHSSNASNTEVFGINLITGTNSNVDVYNNTITFTAAASTANVYGINNTIGGTPLGNHVNIYNNRLINWTLSSFTTGVCYMIYNTSSANADSVNIYNNTISDVTVGGTGAVYGIYQAASANNINIYGDTVRNISRTGSGIVYSIYNTAVSTTIGTEKIYNNVISNVGSSSTSTLNLMYLSSAPIKRYVYSNSINNCSTGGATVNGIYQSGGINNFIYNNKIDNLTSNNAASTVYGINNVSGTFDYTYNNFISNLNTPLSNTLTSAYGLYIGAPVTYLGAFNNSIYLNSTSSGASFGNIGVYVGSSASNTIDLRNNNIVNNSTPGATGRTVGVRYSSTTYTNYHSGSGANNIYMGSPVPVSLRSFFFDGTNSDSTLIGFQNRVTPREQGSVSENPAFVNAAAGDLHITGASLLKQGGYPVSSVPVGPAFSFTTDIDGAARDATYFDIGADEFAGTRTAGTAPNIVYTLLGTGNTSNRVLSAVTIQDPDGVDNTNKARVYYKKFSHANTFNDNTNTTDGWKYAVTTSTGSPYSFTIDYSNIFGGSVSLGDTINYFVVAQDLAGTPTVGINAGAFALLPANVNLISAAFPVTGNVNKYIIAGSLSAGINVGAGETYTSLTGAAPTGLFAAINSGELAGNLTVNITSDLYETGATQLNPWNEQKAAGQYSLTIKPSDTATYVRTISGWVANSMIRFNGPYGVTIDGGSGKFLRFRQMTVGQPTFLLTNGTQNVTIKNCNIEGSNTSTTVGIISLTTANTLLSLGNSNITINNNNISARSDTTGPVPKIGISSIGTNTPGLLNSNNTITNNNIFNFELDGVYMTTGNGDGWVIKKNSFYYNHSLPMTTGTVGWTAVFFNAGINSNGNTIDSNFVGGSAPLCAGTPTDFLLIEPQCLYMSAGHNIQSTIRGNIIKNMRSRWMMSSSTNGYAISGAGGWIDISGNYIGSADTVQNIVTNHNFRAITFTSTLINANVPKPITCNNNIINNITSRGDTLMPSAVTRVGISFGGNANADVIGNTISNFDYKVNPNVTGNNYFIIGILPNSGGINVVKSNTILNLGYNTSQARTSTGRQFCYGLQPSALGNGSILSENKITNLYINGPSKINGDLVYGISNVGSLAGTSMTVSNNQITILGNSSDTTTVFGIADGSSTANINTYAYNTVVIGGTVSSPVFTSAGFWKSSTSCVSTLRNNIFYNGRTGGTAGHIAIGTATNTLYKGNAPVPEALVVYAEGENLSNNISSSPMGPVSPKFDSDFNLFIAPFNGQLTAWYTAYQTFAGWQTSSGGDYNSYSDTSLNVPAGTMFRNISAGNLNIDTTVYTSLYVYKNGTGIAGINKDFNGYPRNTSGPVNIGSHEFSLNGNALSSLVSPANNSTGNQIPVTLVWRKSLYASGYNIQVSADSTFATTSIDLSQSDSTYIFSNANPLIKYYWRVAPVYPNGRKNTYTSAYNFKVIGTPTQITLNYPVNNAVNLPVAFTFKWFKSADQTLMNQGKAGNDVSKNAKNDNSIRADKSIGNYWFQLSTDSTFATILVNDSTLTDTTKAISSLSQITKYYWRVMAKNQFGWGNVSSVWNFTTVPPVPVVPTLVSPANNSVDLTTTPTLDWNDVTYAVSYRTQISTSAAFTTVLYDTVGLTASQISIPGSVLTTNTQYFWRVSATNISGTSSYSTIWNFTTAPNVPNVPTLSTPANGSINLPTTVIFKWFKAIETLADNKEVKTKQLTKNGSDSPDAIVNYWFEYSTDSSFTTGVTIDSLLTDTTKSVSGLNNLTKYYWRVKAKNQTGWASYSAFWNFTTVPTVPNAPTLVSPANNSTGNPVSLNLVWTKPTLATGYNFVLATDAGFTAIVLNDSTLTDSVKALTNLTPLTTYYWKVRAKNAGGWGSFSSSFNFKTVGSPTQVVLSLPSNNATNQPVNLTFNWFKAIDQTLISVNKGGNKNSEQSDEPLTVSNYWFEYSTSVSFTTSVIDSLLTDTTKSVTGLSNNTAYYWRVRAKNQIGWAAYSAVWTFTTIPTVPNAPALVSPVNNSTGNPLNLILVWTKPSTAMFYNVVIATDAGFTNIILNDSTLTDSVKTLTGLTPLTTYYWKVKAKNVAGWGSFSSTSNFKTVGTPTTVVLSVPSNNAVNQPVDLTFKWFKAVDQTLMSVNKGDKKGIEQSDEPLAVSNYWFELSTDSTFATGVTRDSTLTDTTKSVTGLNPGSNYYWRVKAKNQIGWGTFSARFKFTTLVPTLSLNLKVYLEGFWDGTTQISDTVMVYLANSTTFALVDTAKVVLSGTGTASMNFNRVTTGSYYIVVNHRNHLETWSKLPQSFVGGTPLSYDFTTAMTQAYGDNMKQVGSVWVLFGGDANRDGSIDANDIGIFITEFGSLGYLRSDFNGDQDVNASDVTIIANNFGLIKITPGVEPLAPETIKGMKTQLDNAIKNNALKELTGKNNSNKSSSTEKKTNK